MTGVDVVVLLDLLQHLIRALLQLLCTENYLLARAPASNIRAISAIVIIIVATFLELSVVFLQCRIRGVVDGNSRRLERRRRILF
jgi:hypothetical protein